MASLDAGASDSFNSSSPRFDENARRRRFRGSVAVATALGGLVLAVFAVSANQGPASAVRRFHQSVIDRDLPATKLDLVPSNPQSEQAFINEVAQLLRASQSVELGRVQARGRTALVDVVYRDRFGQALPVRYVMVKRQLRWQVDPMQTLDLRRAMFDFS
jgi:hypothetical protein